MLGGRADVRQLLLLRGESVTGQHWGNAGCPIRVLPLSYQVSYPVSYVCPIALLLIGHI